MGSHSSRVTFCVMAKLEQISRRPTSLHFSQSCPRFACTLTQAQPACQTRAERGESVAATRVPSGGDALGAADFEELGGDRAPLRAAALGVEDRNHQRMRAPLQLLPFSLRKAPAMHVKSPSNARQQLPRLSGMGGGLLTEATMSTSMMTPPSCVICVQRSRHCSTTSSHASPPTVAFSSARASANASNKAKLRPA